MLKALTAEAVKFFSPSLLTERKGQVPSRHGPSPREGPVGEIPEPAAEPQQEGDGEQAKGASQDQKAAFRQPAGPPTSRGDLLSWLPRRSAQSCGPERPSYAKNPRI